jgi:hypothetical protein
MATVPIPSATVIPAGSNTPGLGAPTTMADLTNAQAAADVAAGTAPAAWLAYCASQLKRQAGSS